MTTNIIELRNITQTYTDKSGKPFNLFEDMSFAIVDRPDKGQFVAIMGESGCGKSTILRYITGLQKPTKGEILINGKLITDKDTIPMVFQRPSSLEWYSVLENVALPLILKNVPKKEAEEKAAEMIRIVGLSGHEFKYAKSPGLSGGQLQRVAIARSLVANPNMIMMDEPFSALDRQNRRKMQDFLAELFQNSELANLNPTVLLVTHDEREAAYLATDVLIMKANPSGIKNYITLDLDNRKPSIRDTPSFIDVVKYLENSI